MNSTHLWTANYNENKTNPHAFWLTFTHYFQKIKGRESSPKGDLAKGKSLEVR